MRDHESRIKSMSPALLLGLFVLQPFSSCDPGQKATGPSKSTGLLLPEGVLFEPDSELSPQLVLESRPGKTHLLHVTVKVRGGQQLLRLRLLGPGPTFQEMGRKDPSQLDSTEIKEAFEIAAGASSMQARHVLVIADFESGSYAASQALPNF